MAWHGRYHVHDIKDWEIHLFLEGNGQILLNRSKYNIERNRLVLTKPKEFHSILPDAVRKPITYYAILFEPKENEATELVSNMENSPALKGIESREHFLVEDLCRMAREHDPNKQKAAEYLLLSLLYRWYGAVKSGSEDHNEEFKDKREYISKTLSIMEKSIAKKLDIGELADSLNLSKEHLIRIFHNRLGITPFQYFTRLRIEAASSYLTSTDFPVQSVAEHFGFENPFHFSRIFKKCTGLSPVEYRRIFTIHNAIKNPNNTGEVSHPPKQPLLQGKVNMP